MRERYINSVVNIFVTNIGIDSKATFECRIFFYFLCFSYKNELVSIKFCMISLKFLHCQGGPKCFTSAHHPFGPSSDLAQFITISYNFLYTSYFIYTL
jgi:hypothetical protein